MKDDVGSIPGDGPGWTIVALVFIIGMAIGVVITRSPIQARSAIPGPGISAAAASRIKTEVTGEPRIRGTVRRVLAPSLRPLFLAALMFPLCLFFARKGGRMRVAKRMTLFWVTLVIGATASSELIIYLFIGQPALRPSPWSLTLEFITIIPFVAASAAFANAIEHRRRSSIAWVVTANARADLATAQLHALSAQLRPHFLFNTLQTVSTLMHRDVAAADAVVGRLGELLHASLKTDTQRVIPIADELRIVDAYLAIAHERFGTRLQSAVDVNVRATDAVIPPFLLQPLVENAVIHGLEPLTGGGMVRISIVETDGMLAVVVSDNGMGFNREESDGVGLSNTRRRLEGIYGDRASLVVNANPGGGTIVRIDLPVAPDPPSTAVKAETSRMTAKR